MYVRSAVALWTETGSSRPSFEWEATGRGGLASPRCVVRRAHASARRSQSERGWWFARSRAKILAGGSGFGVILYLKLRAALGKGGSRCLFVVGSRSGAVTPAPLLPLCRAQRRYYFPLDDEHWMDNAPPRRRPQRRQPAPLDEP